MDNNIYEEKIINPINGWIILAVVLAMLCGSISLVMIGLRQQAITAVIVGGTLIVVCLFLCTGFRILNPNEAYVLTLFGKYYGSLKKEGFFWVIPFCSAFNPANTKIEDVADIIKGNKISLKARTLNNDKQKVNDSDGNPIEIGVVVIWRISDTAKAVFKVDNYLEFISTQSDAVIRNIARQYPYDLSEQGEEKSLRGSSQEIANMLCDDLQNRVSFAGIEIVEARISHLAYAQEIAAAMLQRQQANAIVDARTKIVEGAVGMVELALDKLKASSCVELNNERKAQMVTNLMVVLCSNKDTQPIVNSGNNIDI